MPIFKLSNQVSKAFAEVKKPQIEAHGISPDSIFAELGMPESWQKWKGRDCADGAHDLVMLTPEWFHFLAPSYLLHSLAHFKEEADVVTEFLVWNFDPNFEARGVPAQRERIAAFTAEQKKVIADYLTFMSTSFAKTPLGAMAKASVGAWGV